MEKRIFVRELLKMEKVKTFSDLFLVTSKSILKTNAGKSYISMVLKDATGEIDGRVWDNVEELSSRFNRDNFVYLTGSLVSHLGKKQIKVMDIHQAADSAIDSRDFVPSTRESVDSMWNDLMGYIQSLDDGAIRDFLSELISSPEVADGLKSAPAGKRLHHGYIGGLLEHTLSVTTICDFLASHYRESDRSMLIAGAILHDIGKIYELSYSRSFDYTDEGRLLGHISMGSELVSRFEREKGLLGKEKEMLLKHMILSHHGEFEFGSPKRPKTLEAVILHFVENMDSKVNAFLSVLEEGGEENWSDFQRMFSRYLYIKRTEE